MMHFTGKTKDNYNQDFGQSEFGKQGVLKANNPPVLYITHIPFVLFCKEYPF